jgi:hypothetical protein
MSNWDDVEAREAYLIRLGFAPNYVANKGVSWIMQMTTQA